VDITVRNTGVDPVAWVNKGSDSWWRDVVLAGCCSSSLVCWTISAHCGVDKGRVWLKSGRLL